MTQHNTFQATLRINITKLPPTGDATGNRKVKAWPAAKAAEAEVEFIGGVADGHTLTGFTLWHAQDERLFVTGPQRTYDKKGETQYFQFFRAKNKLVHERFADLMIAEYQRILADRTEREYPATDPTADDPDEA